MREELKKRSLQVTFPAQKWRFDGFLKIFFKDKCDRIFHFDSSKNEHLLWIQLSKNVFNNFVEYLAPVALFFAKYHKVLQLLLRMRGKHGKNGVASVPI